MVTSRGAEARHYGPWGQWRSLSKLSATLGPRTLLTLMLGSYYCGLTPGGSQSFGIGCIAGTTGLPSLSVFPLLELAS